MDTVYFNHYPTIAVGRRDRRRFVSQWWRIYRDDNHWVPPYYPTLLRELQPSHNPHVARLEPVLLSVEAMSRSQARGRRSLGRPQPFAAVSLFEAPVAAAIALLDPRRKDGAGYLALLRCINDLTTMRRLFEFLAEALRRRGYHRIIGPTGLSPHLATGLLQDHWDQLPPLHTPYDPPYMPELLGSTMRPLARCLLYHLEIPLEPRRVPPSPAQLLPLETARLATDLLPLVVAACPSWAGFLATDTEEAAFLLRWLGTWPLYGWLAHSGDQPVGFVLLQPDLAPQLRRAGGGQRRLWRLLPARAIRQPTRHGRLLALGVLPEWRGQGIGLQLLQQALVAGAEQGWRTLSVGPVPTTAPACAFLERHGGRPRQSYLLYERNL